MWGCGKTAAGRDEIAIAVGKRVQYPWMYTNVLTGKDNFAKVLRDAKEQMRNERNG